MAHHKIHKKDEDDFFDALQNRDFDLVEKLVDSILKAIDKNKKKVDAFEVFFPDGSSLMFTVTKDNYKECLENCISDFAKQEMYEKCTEIIKIINTI
jgi:hypothetical protein